MELEVCVQESKTKTAFSLDEQPNKYKIRTMASLS